MLFLSHFGWLTAVGVLVACAMAARSYEWGSCKRNALTGQKPFSHLLANLLFRGPLAGSQLK